MNIYVKLDYKNLIDLKEKIERGDKNFEVLFLYVALINKYGECLKKWQPSLINNYLPFMKTNDFKIITYAICEFKKLFKANNEDGSFKIIKKEDLNQHFEELNKANETLAKMKEEKLKDNPNTWGKRNF